MTSQEFHNFSEWKEQFLHHTKNEKPVEMSNQELLNAYISEKESFEEMKKQRIENKLK